MVKGTVYKEKLHTWKRGKFLNLSLNYSQKQNYTVKRNDQDSMDWMVSYELLLMK